MPKKLVCIEMEIIAPAGKQIHPDFTAYTMRWPHCVAHVASVLEALGPDESVSIRFTRQDWTPDEFELMVEAADWV